MRRWGAHLALSTFLGFTPSAAFVDQDARVVQVHPPSNEASSNLHAQPAVTKHQRDVQQHIYELQQLHSQTAYQDPKPHSSFKLHAHPHLQQHAHHTMPMAIPRGRSLELEQQQHSPHLLQAENPKKHFQEPNAQDLQHKQPQHKHTHHQHVVEHLAKHQLFGEHQKDQESRKSTGKRGEARAKGDADSSVEHEEEIAVEVLRSEKTGTCQLHGVKGPKQKAGHKPEFFCVTTGKIVHHSVSGALKLNQLYDTRLKCDQCLGDYYPIKFRTHPPPQDNYGPENCIHSYLSEDRTCIVETKNCTKEAVAHTNVGFLCVREDGTEKQKRHFFGLNSFQTSQIVDTGIKCNHCFSSDRSIMPGEEHVVDHEAFLETKTLWMTEKIKKTKQSISDLSKLLSKAKIDKQDFLQEKRKLSLVLSMPDDAVSHEEGTPGGGIDLSEW